jgi:hypothetical protein
VRLSIGELHRRGLADGFAFAGTQRISNVRLPSVTVTGCAKIHTRSTEQRGPPNLIDVMADACSKSKAKFRTIKSAAKDLKRCALQGADEADADGRQCLSTTGQSCSGTEQ